MNSKKQLTTPLAIVVPVLFLSFCAWKAVPPSSPKQVGIFHNLKVGESVRLRNTKDHSRFYVSTFTDSKIKADDMAYPEAFDIVKEVEKDFIVVFDADKNEDILIPVGAIQSIRTVLKQPIYILEREQEKSVNEQ